MTGFPILCVNAGAAVACKAYVAPVYLRLKCSLFGIENDF